jgi:D-3-phosphoglycerate dehydrogenase
VPPPSNKHRCAVLDDYQDVALRMADWSGLTPDVDITVFNRPLGSVEEIARTLRGFTMVVLTRERTAFPRALIEALPDLQLIVTTGARNPSLDVAAAREHGITVCNTPTVGNPTALIAMGLMIELTRHIGQESERLKAGAFWQATIGPDLDGKTLGVIGLGKLGSRVARIAQAMGMTVIAWSPNLTQEKCRTAGVSFAGSKDKLLGQADVVTIHLVLGPRSRGLIGARELSLMKPTAYLVNTARGPIVDAAALIEALQERRIAGAGLDVFDKEPLPADHPLRRLDNVVLSPHLGYVTQENFRASYGGVVEDIRAFLDGEPIRILEPT